MTKEDLIKEYGSIKAAKADGWEKAPYSNKWVKVRGKH